MALRRLGLGALAGLLLGVVLGLAFSIGLGWTTTTGLLSTLIAMGGGATAAAFIGRAPWEQSGFIESALRMIVGVAIGAGLIFVASRYLAASIPYAFLGAPEDTLWHEMPVLYLPFVTTFYGAFLGLEAGSGPKAKSTKGVRGKGNPPPPPPPVAGFGAR
jgi:hypothetical protein